MKKILIWDLPTRLFHWAFAGFLTASIMLSLVVDEDSPLFQWHMLCGLAAASLLAVRVVLGILGSRHVRFTSFPVKPSEIAGYAAGVFSGKAKRYAEHNPGAAVAALSMLTGRKEGPPEDGLTSAHPAWGLAFLLAGGAWVAALFASHDARAATVRVPVLGAVVTLGEKGSHDEGHDRRKRGHDDD